MKIAEFISAKAMENMRLEISKSGGNEVFFRGIPDGEGIVSEVEVIARGNSSSVAALLNMMRKNEVIIHNHPSGDSRPSDDDIRVTKLFVSAGQFMGIPVLDHIVIGDGEFTSLSEIGKLS